jgi:hypothetical protein
MANLAELIFVKKKRLNDSKVCFKWPFNLVVLIEKYLKLEEQFEGLFEWDEIVDIWNYGRFFFLSFFVIIIFFLVFFW